MADLALPLSDEAYTKRIAQVWAETMAAVHAKRQEPVLVDDQLYDTATTSHLLTVPVRTLEGCGARGYEAPEWFGAVSWC